MIESRQELESRIGQVMAQFKNHSVLPKPPDWGGYAIEPTKIEFWQGRQSRLHDRILYTRINGSWIIKRLAP